jgi:light-regulated signal transduction histidine kinase (bacteriophytochrome)
MLQKVEKTNRELKDFTSIVSHDLKTPLRGIKTVAKWIQEDCRDKFSEETNEQMDLLLERVERMYNLIDGVLRYSKVGWSDEGRTQVNLDKFVKEVIDMIAPPENIEVIIENKLPEIWCQETHMLQLFQNLLVNAIKYMDKSQGRIKISCLEEGGFWKFSVADNGPGIDEKHFERIFEMFQCLSIKTKHKGNGVGLTVVKKIIESYGGKIWLESKIDKGATFFFTLPRQGKEAANNISQTTSN